MVKAWGEPEQVAAEPDEGQLHVLLRFPDHPRTVARRNRELPRVDVYVGTFDCRPAGDRVHCLDALPTPGFAPEPKP